MKMFGCFRPVRLIGRVVVLAVVVLGLQALTPRGFCAECSCSAHCPGAACQASGPCPCTCGCDPQGIPVCFCGYIEQG